MPNPHPTRSITGRFQFTPEDIEFRATDADSQAFTQAMNEMWSQLCQDVQRREERLMAEDGRQEVLRTVPSMPEDTPFPPTWWGRHFWGPPGLLATTESRHLPISTAWNAVDPLFSLWEGESRSARPMHQMDLFDDCQSEGE